MGRIRENISKNIKIHRERLGLKQKDLAEKIGVKNTSISNWENGSNSPDIETLFLMCELFGVTVGEMYGINVIDSTPPTPEQIPYYNELDEIDKVIIYVSDLYSNPKYRVKTTNANYEIGNLIDFQAYKLKQYGKAAGGSPIFACEDVKIIESPIKADCALELVGHSMEPEYPDGCTLLINRNVDIKDGDLVIALITHGAEISDATFKKFYRENGNVRLVPLNKDYEEMVYPFGDVTIWGKVIGKIERSDNKS